MPGNPENDITEILVRYMDDELTPGEKATIAEQLQQDAVLNERYQLLLAAKQAIRMQGLKQRVQNLHKEYVPQTKELKQEKIVGRTSFFKTFMRIAAVFIIVVAGYGVFEFALTNDQSVYEDHFLSYELPVNRGLGTSNTIDSLYAAKNYAGTIEAFNAKQHKIQQDYFLAAQCYLQLNNAGKAIEAFQDVENLNNVNAQKSFVQETDYYLALAYIKAGNIDAGKRQIDKILSDKEHLFYNKAKQISGIQLKILQLKNK